MENSSGPLSTESSRDALTSRLFGSVIEYPRTCLVILLCLTLLAWGGYYRPTWPKEVWTRVMGSTAEVSDFTIQPEPRSTPRSRRRARPATNSRETLGRADAFLVIQSPDIFTRDGAAALRHLVSKVSALDVVADVRSLDEAPPLNIFGLPEPILPRGQASAQRFALSKKKAVQHPLVVGQLLSPDAETLLVQVQYNFVFVQEDADCTTRLLETARAAAAEHPNVKMKIDLTGPIPFRLMLMENEKSNELKFQLIGYGMILFMAMILFRGLSVVLVVAAAPILGVFWTLGFLRYFDLQYNPFSNVILPVLLSLVGFTDGVHMIVHIRQGIMEGKLPREACKHTLRMVGLACLLTSLTTAIGMGSLTIARHEVVREFGWSCVLGVTATWISVMLVIPLACSTKWSKRFAKGADRGFIERNLGLVSPMVALMIAHCRLVSYLAIALLIVLGGIALRLQPDDRKSNALPSGSDTQKALAHVDRAMGGLDICTVSIAWKPEELTDYQSVSLISNIDAILRREPLIGHPLSLSRLLEAFPGEGSAADKVSMAQLLPPPLMDALYQPDQGKASIVFRCQDLGTKAYKPTFERIEAAFQGLEKESESKIMISMSGDPIWRWRDLYQIVTDLVSSLGSASVVIFVIMGVAYRSVRLGLISVIPNLIPLAASASWMAFTGQPLEIVSVCAFTVCIGIAVDDTIHFLSRYREEILLTTDRNLAIQRAFQGVGAGLIMTTLVLVAGFSSVLTSDTRDHRIFASLGLVTLISALLCDLFLLPALLAYFDRTHEKKS